MLWATNVLEASKEQRGLGVAYQCLGAPAAIEAGRYAPSLVLAFQNARAFGRTVAEVFQFNGDAPRGGDR